MTLTLSSARDLLARMNACDESSRWLAVLPSDTTPESAWSTCPRGDWLVWLLGRLHRAGVLSRQTLTLAGCAAARTSLVHLAGTPWHAPSLAAIETTERWCRGEATPEEVRKARHAAWEARNAAADAAADAYAAAAAAAAAADAAYAAAAAAADAYAAADAAAAYAAAAYAAADADAYAAAAAYAADAADAAAARAKRRQEIADAVRAVVPWSLVERALGGVAVTLTLHTASCSVHVPAALREHQRPIVDALLDATFAGTLSEAHVGQARSDGSLVVWSAPPEAVADVVRAYALAARIEVKATCTLCRASRRCPVHGEVSP